VTTGGSALVDDPDRIDSPTALRLDETLFVRVGPRHRKRWSASTLDVRAGRLLVLFLVAAVSSRGVQITKRQAVGWNVLATTSVDGTS
jgi:hypothetical protein